MDPQYHGHPGVARIHGLSAASQCLNKTGMRDLACACEAATQAMESEYMALLHDQKGRAVLSSKSCDGSPMCVAKRVNAKLASGTIVGTRGEAAA